MATPGARAREEQEVELLSELYLSLWKQLDLVSSESKWLDVKSASPTELRQQAERSLKALTSQFSSCDVPVVTKDFERTQTFVEGAKEAEGEIEAFKEYLRDLALRYSQASDGMQSV